MAEPPAEKAVIEPATASVAYRSLGVAAALLAKVITPATAINLKLTLTARAVVVARV